MATPTKVSAVAEITNDFKESNAAVLTEYRGLTVAQLKQLRVSLGQDTKFAVVKNTLTAIAAKEAGVHLAFLRLSCAITFLRFPRSPRPTRENGRMNLWPMRVTVKKITINIY